MTVAIARVVVDDGAPSSSHLYGPLMPSSFDDNARMLQSVAESGGLVTNPGLCAVHGEYDAMSLSYFHIMGL